MCSTGSILVDSGHKRAALAQPEMHICNAGHARPAEGEGSGEATACADQLAHDQAHHNNPSPGKLISDGSIRMSSADKKCSAVPAAALAACMHQGIHLELCGSFRHTLLDHGNNALTWPQTRQSSYAAG